VLTSTTPYHRSLGNNLVLKSIDDQDDAQRLAAFNGQIFGSIVTEMTRALLLHHPNTRPEQWLYIEDDAKGQIVSALCLIPWQWRYEDVTLKAGEMGIVGTLDAYRNRGLIRALDTRFKELLREGEFDLSQIQGIPYFYRQFGYEYTLPLEPNWHIDLHNIPTALPESPYRYRLATVDDIPVLMQMYEDAAKTLNISALRSADIWRFMLECTAGTDMEAEIWLMLKGDTPVGYWRVMRHGFGTGLIVSDTSRLSHDATTTLLHHLKTVAVERGKPNIRFNLPENHDLLRTARAWGATNPGTYAWQIHLVDVGRLLRKLTPVLERRINASPFNGLSQKVIVNLYREAFELHFEGGKLLAVNNIGFSDGGEIRIPPMQFTQLVLGYRTHEELRQNYPDVAVWGQARALVDVLFPKMDSFIYSIY
jgi:predicted acetyltransferase